MCHLGHFLLNLLDFLLYIRNPMVVVVDALGSFLVLLFLRRCYSLQLLVLLPPFENVLSPGYYRQEYLKFRYSSVPVNPSGHYMSNDSCAFRQGFPWILSLISRWPWPGTAACLQQIHSVAFAQKSHSSACLMGPSVLSSAPLTCFFSCALDFITKNHHQ